MGTIFDIKDLAIHDGKGLRTTIFLKGCPLNCVWCHNPEGKSISQEIMIYKNRCKHCGLCDKKCNHIECQPFNKCLHICPENLIKLVGEEISAKDLADRVLKNSDFLLEGGVTFSGGEPLYQADFLLECISYLNGINIAIETSGYCDTETFKKVIDKVDYVYMDIKLFDEELHLKYTGVSNSLILQNLEILRQSNKPCTIRTPLIPNITDSKANIEAIKKLVNGLNYELLPYNEFSQLKYDALNN